MFKCILLTRPLSYAALRCLSTRISYDLQTFEVIKVLFVDNVTKPPSAREIAALKAQKTKTKRNPETRKNTAMCVAKWTNSVHWSKSLKGEEFDAMDMGDWQ